MEGVFFCSCCAIYCTNILLDHELEFRDFYYSLDNNYSSGEETNTIELLTQEDKASLDNVRMPDFSLGVLYLSKQNTPPAFSGTVLKAANVLVEKDGQMTLMGSPTEVFYIDGDAESQAIESKLEEYNFVKLP